jgi:hypothetical protein
MIETSPRFVKRAARRVKRGAPLALLPLFKDERTIGSYDYTRAPFERRA